MDIIRYQRLVRKVRLFNKSAADYLEFYAIKLPDFDYEENLISCFSWKETPQGFTYWKDLHFKVVKLNKSMHKFGIREND